MFEFGIFKRIGPLRPIPIASTRSLNEHEKIQKNTFTRWVNYHLETHSSSGQIRDLFEDLRDGVYLCHLIEVLTGEALPVNKARVSKRVHHISNLTTALSVLRRRGCELVNNNPTDLADGNPRIILGLIWQMILHFQIETNLNLMRELGWEPSVELHSASPSTSAQSTPKRSSLLPSGLHKQKTTAERILLDWIQREIGRKYNIQINDMDRSWRDGIAFMALVHRSNSALVDMNEVRNCTPRENLERAFELARVHLNIRPLLEVDDVLHEKPDKRSIIAYVSQFLRAPTASRLVFHAPSAIPERYLALIEWIKITASHERVALFSENKNNLPSDFFADHEWFSHRRREFFERRILFIQLEKESHHLPPEEWARLSSDWKAISDILREWSHRLESELPESLIGLSQWLTSGEQLVHSLIDVSRDKARYSLWVLDSMLENLKKHFKGLTNQREKLQRALAGCTVPTEVIAPLEVRLEALSEEYKIRLETLMLIRAHYRILVLIEELGKKIETWRNAESLKAIKMWFDEYLKESTKDPGVRLHTLLAEMHEAIPSEPPALNTEAQQSYSEAYKASEELITNFREMRRYLEELLDLWEQFEADTSKMDTTLNRFEREKLLADDSIRELLNKLETIGDSLGRKSNQVVRSGIKVRIGNYRRRVQELSRPIGGRLVVNIHPPVISNPILPLQGPANELAELSCISALRDTKLERWLISISHLLRKRVKSAQEAARLAEKMQEHDRQVVELEEEKWKLYRVISSEDKDKINEVYKRYRTALPARMGVVRSIQPMLSNVEQRLREMDLYVKNDRRSELFRLPVRERTEYLEQAALLLDSIEEKHSDIVNSGQLRLELANLRSRFEVPSIEVTDAFDSELRTSSNVQSLRDRFEPSSPRVGSKSPTIVDRIADLLDKKRKIIDRREDTSEAAKASILEMKMVNEALTLHKASQHPLNPPMERDWLKKEADLERLILIDIEVNKLNEKLRSAKKPEDYAVIEKDVDSTLKILRKFNSDLPLLHELKRRLKHIERVSVDKRNQQRRMVIETLERKVKELEFSPEEDLAIAEIVIKGLLNEANEFEKSNPQDAERVKELKKDIARVRNLIRLKMEFFSRLQKFYENIKDIHQEQTKYRTITSAQIDDVRAAIDLRLRQVNEELRAEADSLEQEFQGINAAFFQLECERIKEKFRLLVAQLEKARRLMNERVLFLKMLTEFRETVEQCVQLSERARQLPLSSFQTSDEIEAISNDLNDLQSKAHQESDRISEQQRRAEMTVTDFEHSVQQLNEATRSPSALVGYDNERRLLERIEALDRELGPLLAVIIRPFEPRTEATHNQDQQPISSQATDYILNNMDASAKEKAIIDEIARCLERLPTASTSFSSKLQKQRITQANRDKERRENINNAIAECVGSLRKEIKRVDSSIDDAIAKRQNDEIARLDTTEWKHCKQTLADLERSLDEPGLRQLKENWMAEFRDIEHLAFNIDGKLVKFYKQNEREQRLLRNLAAFAEWIELVESDIKELESRDDLEQNEKETQLLKIKENCEKHQRLANKLENFNFQSEPQAKFAKEQIAKYRVLVDKLNRMNLTSPKTVPIRIRTDLTSTNPAVQSQLSVASTSSFGSELEKKLGEDELDSDLASVHSEVIRAESEKVARPSSALGAAVQKEAELLRQIAKSGKEIPTDQVKQIVSNITEQLRAIRDFYEIIPLKTVERAEQDIPNLKELLATATSAEKQMDSILKLVKNNPSEHALLQSIENDLKNEKTAGITLAEQLENEVEDEKQLRFNYDQIMRNLNALEQEVKSASEQGRKPETKERLQTIELQMTVLRKLCKKPRKYIASSIDGSPQSTPTRRRKIVLKITNSVMTIIKCVEDEMNKQPTGTSASTSYMVGLSPALQHIYEQLRLIKSKMEEDLSPPCSAQQSIDAGEETSDIENLIQQADKIKASVEELGTMDQTLQEPEEYGLLIKASREGRSGLEQILQKIDEVEGTPESVKDYRSRVVDLIQSLLNLEDQLKEKQLKSQEIQNQYRGAVDTITQTKEMAEAILKEENPSISQLTKASDLVNDEIKKSEHLVDHPEKRVAGLLADDLDVGHKSLQMIAKKLDDRLQHIGQLQNLVTEAYATIDPLNDQVRNIANNALFDIAQGKEKYDILKKSEDKQHRLGELVQLIRELAPTEPVIPLIEKARNTVAVVQDGLLKEIQDEEMERQKQDDLQQTFNNIEINDNELPVLEVMKSSIEAAVATPIDRIYIKSNHEKLYTLLNNINEKQQQIASKTEADRQKSIAKAEEEISLLSQQPDIGEEAFERIHSQLEQLPENDPIVVSLTKQVADIKAKKDAMDALKRKLNDDIDATAAKLRKIEDEIIPGSAEEGKKKGKKSKKPKEIAGANRDEQIANLRHAIDDIDSQIVPKLNDIARVANENTMDVPTLPTEQQKAEELSKQLKDKLAEKEAEKSKAGKAVKNTDDLNKVIKQTAVEVPSIDPQENLENIMVKANELKKVLETIDEEPEDIQNILTDEQKADREQARNKANDLLKQLLEKCADLQKQLDALKEWNKKKQDLDDQVNQLSDSVKSLENEFSSSQPLSAAKDGVRRGEALEPAIKEVEKQLKKNRDWLQQQLPNNPEVQTELNNINDQLNTLNQTRQNLMNKLQNDINKADELVADQNALIDKINKLNNDAIAIHKSDDIAEKPAALIEIHHQLKPLQEKLDQLEKRADDPNSLVYNEDALNLPLIRERLTNIGQSLNEQQKDAADKLALAGISSNLDREISDLRNEVDKAERIDNDPAATEDDLHNAINGLNDSQQHVQQIDNLISQLDQNNPDAQALKNKVSNDVAQLRECLDGTRQSLADRADLLKDFNNEIDQLAKNLDLIAQNSDSIKPETATLDDIDTLKKQNTNIGEKLNNLTQKLDELKPLNQPAVRHNNLIQLQKAVDEKLNQLQNAIQAENDKKQIAEAFNNELNKVEELLNEAEKAIENSPADSQILDQLGNEKLQPLNSLIADIDNQSIPNEELKKRKKALKKQAQALNDKYGKKFTNAKEQEDLLKKINDELSELEGLTGNITSTYGQPKSLSEAIEDKNALNKINERLGPLPIDEIADKPTRDSLVKRVEQIRNEVNTLNSPLAEEIKKEERLLQDGQDILEKINNLGIQVLTLGETGTPEDNLKKIGELSDNLRKLRKDAEIIDSKIQQPQEHVQHGLEGENLTGRIDQLQNNLADKKKELENQSKLAEIVPQLQLATESVQQKVANLESEIPQTLEQQEVALKDLQDEKRRLEDLLENLPEGPESDETREQSKWNLSKITDWLKKLGDAVGEKAAALYAFLNSKKAIEDQLKVLNDDINAAEAEADSASPQGLQDKINALLAEEARIEAIRAKLSDDQINPENLDEDKRQELEQLRRAVDTASSKLQKARDQLQNKLDDAIAKEHLQADTNHCHNELANLIKQAYETINDPTVLPSYYKELADRLHNEIQNANNVINNSQNHPEIIEPLNNLIPTANDVEKLLNNRHNLWLEFIKERDIANEQLDIARKPLDEFEGQTDLRSLPVAEKQLDDLKVIFENFQASTAVDNALQLCEALHPLQSVDGEVRFMQVDKEEAEADYETVLNKLSTEISEEKGLETAAQHIDGTLRSMLNTVTNAIENRRLEDLSPLAQDLDSLKASVSDLRNNIESMTKSRKYVKVGEYPIIDNLDGPLSEMETKIANALQMLQVPELELPSPDDEPLHPDYDALADIIAKAYPNRNPRDVLREHGYEDLIPEDYQSDMSSSRSGFNTDAESQPSSSRVTDEDYLVSAIPEDPSLENPQTRAHYLRQRSRWRRILRTALPLQAMLVLLLGAACLVPQCDDAYCCQMLNNFIRSFEPALDFPNGPPPF